MKGYELISCHHTINATDAAKVRALADSMLANGWTGCPILTFGEQLLTGSHRLAALKLISGENDSAAVLDQDVSEDVSEIVENNLRAYEEENGWVPDIDFANIGWLLSGSWVEEYKAEIAEW